jgi:two-component system alkaline phosphatase synthesis response regulator PhoP
MKSRLLLVACAPDLPPSLSTNLAATGCRVRFATSGLELLKKARRRLPDLIVLDATLPDMDVTTVCEILSRLPSTATVPRLLLAARKCAFSEALPISGSPGDRPAPPFNSEELKRRVHEMLGAVAHPPGQMADRDAA